MTLSRRSFIRKSTSLFGAAVALTGCEHPRIPSQEELIVEPGELFFDISLAEWSMHRMFWFEDLDHLEFAAIAKRDFGITAVEYVSQFFSEKVSDRAYLLEMKRRADDVDVRSLLIMVDMAGNLVSHQADERTQAVENHYAWIEAAKTVGCHSIRANLPGKGTAEEISGYAIESLGRLAEFAAPMGINILIEPHGSYSSNGAWLANVMNQVDMENCGTLPDFGNFVLNLFPYKTYDRYKGVEELMPYAKGISAKTHRFDEQGNETTIDFYKMMRIVKEAGYTGHIGIEYEGNQLNEYDGIRATKYLLIQAGRAANT